MQSYYEQRICRQFPGLFVILLDQSASMSEEVEGMNHPFMVGITPSGQYGKFTKADIATAAINKIIYTIIDKAGTDEFTNLPKNYAYLCVLGYHQRVLPLVTKGTNTTEPIKVAELASRPPLGTHDVKELIPGPFGHIERVRKKPYWILPSADGPGTFMALAFEYAKAVVERWLNTPSELISPQLGKQALRSKSFPPVVINITDAINTGNDDPVDVAQAIQRCRTDDGNALVFNCHFTTVQGRTTLFPARRTDVSHLDGHGLAEMMFDMSSPIPTPLLPGARKLVQRPLATTARSYVYNADPKALLEFLQWGTMENRRGTFSQHA